MSSTSIPPTAIIGLDIGGSKTRGILWHDGVVIADEQTGSANVQNVSIDEARQNLQELFSLLPTDGVEQIFAGSGGIDTEADAEALASLIRPNVPGVPVTVVHDTRLLLAAGHASVGVAVIAGTGSAAWGINEQHWLPQKLAALLQDESARGSPRDHLSETTVEVFSGTEGSHLLRNYRAVHAFSHRNELHGRMQNDEGQSVSPKGVNQGAGGVR